jgi:hypothetical protein
MQLGYEALLSAVCTSQRATYLGVFGQPHSGGGRTAVDNMIVAIRRPLCMLPLTWQQLSPYRVGTLVSCALAAIPSGCLMPAIWLLPWALAVQTHWLGPIACPRRYCIASNARMGLVLANLASPSLPLISVADSS